MAFTQSFRRIESQLLPRRVEVERYLGYLEHSIEIPAVSSLSLSAHELSLSSSKDLSSIKRSGESSYSRLVYVDWTGQLRGRTIGLLQHTQACDLWKESKKPKSINMAEHTPHGDRVPGLSQMFAGKEIKIVCRVKHTWVSDSLYLAWPRVFLWTLGVARHVDESQNK